MKRILLSLACVLSLGLAVSAQAATYTLDPTHTSVLWHINHFGFSNPSGKWMAQGTLTLDENKLQASQVNVSIEMADLLTGVPKLDEHLKGKDFFNVAQFPKATFVSNKVNVTGKNTANVEGTLTLLGVSKPVILQVVLNKIAINPITNKKTAGFTATTTLKRSDFGLNAYLPNISDAVKIDIEAEAAIN